MKLLSWNVNGIRACVKKGFIDFFTQVEADVFCLQETKLQEGQIELKFEGYDQYWNYAVKKGYSGTAIFTRIKPIAVQYGLGVDEHDQEGRVITLEFDSFFLITVYTPNSKRDLSRLDYRLRWENDFRNFVTELENRKPTIICGDLNVAHQEIDLKNPKSNQNNSEFTNEEREKMTVILDAGFVDSFRYLYPEQTGAYTWWSYMNKVRERNIGWRIDYFLVSNQLKEKIKDSKIYSSTLGSDHCPVGLEISI